MNVSHLLGGAALAVLASVSAAGSAHAQDESGQPVTPPASEQVEETRANEILVTGQIFFRNRTDDVNPVLSYDLEYFQRFEPVSVGEMMRRVPGATFTSDVLEYDNVQFRGLPPGFTQVLINGRRAPGGSADGSFFVDRIPAELVERIEIVRAPRADQPSDGVAGTLNIVTKESTSFEGGFGRLGALINGRDGVFRPSGSLAYAGRLGERADYWFALNYQERRNPKEKVSYRFGDTPVDLDGNYANDPEFDDFEAQDDTRDGSDLSGSAEISTELLGGGRFRLTGFFVQTDRDEDERSLTFEDSTLDFDEVEIQQERIDQRTYAVTSDLRLPLGNLEFGLAGGWNRYRERTDVSVFVGDNPLDYDDVSLDDQETIAIDDEEWTATLYTALASPGFRGKLGLDFVARDRNGLNDGDFLSDAFTISEDRYAPYLRLTFDIGSALTLDAGLRYEITGRRVIGTSASGDYSAEQANPSLHLRWAPVDDGQVRLSFARTLRRPNYDDISPFEQDETPGDDDVTFGNPELRNQDSWGVDLGYEHRIGGTGIVGVNFFYRDITDLIELVAVGSTPAGGQRFTPRNIGDGQTWGVEFDLSTPLAMFGLPDTGIFANYTYLDSSTVDPFTGQTRRFNNQPRHVYNAGFIQTVRPLDMSFGATVSGRSASFESNFDETVELRYDPDLEAFIERRFGRNFVIRLSAQNLLNRTKYEDFRKYDGDSLEEILDARQNGDLDEYEIERETSGPLFQVTLRAAF